MKKKNNKKWTLVLVLLLVVSIGYAALASNLKINGSSSVKSATWDVYWNNVQVTQGSVATTQGNQARITDQAKTQVEYSVVLNEPGDFYEFTVDAVNNGTIDAMIAANGIVNGAYSDANYQNEITLPKTVSYTVTYADGTTIEPKHLLAKKNGNTPTTETYKVRIEYKNDDSINPGDLNNITDQTYYFKFSVNYVQADSTKVARSGGSQTPSNPYLTTFSGIYGYDWDSAYTDEGYELDSNGWHTSLNPEAVVYLRKDSSTNKKEACGVFSTGTVCLTSSNYNSDYSSAGSYENDFEDAIEGEYNSANIDTSGLQGYAKAKAVEMLSKGATLCSIYDGGLYCSDDSTGFCNVDYDQVSCNDYSGVSCLVDSIENSYCSH